MEDQTTQCFPAKEATVAAVSHVCVCLYVLVVLVFLVFFFLFIYIYVECQCACLCLCGRGVACVYDVIYIYICVYVIQSTVSSKNIFFGSAAYRKEHQKVFPGDNIADPCFNCVDFRRLLPL